MGGRYMRLVVCDVLYAWQCFLSSFLPSLLPAFPASFTPSLRSSCTLAHLGKGSTCWRGPVSRCRCAGFMSKRDIIVASRVLSWGAKKDSSKAQRERGNSLEEPRRSVVR